MSKVCYGLDDHSKHMIVDDYDGGYGWKWGSWSIFIIILIAIIAFIWHRNHLHRVCEAKEMGALEAKVCYDHQYISTMDCKQNRDEVYMYSHVDPCQVPRCGSRCTPCCEGPGYGYGYGGYGPGFYGPNYGNGGYGYPGPGFLANGYPPYQVPETKFQKTTCYQQRGHSDITESVVV